MKDYVQYVDPTIGSIGHLLTACMPRIYMPHGMMSAFPKFNTGMLDFYLTDKIYGFVFRLGTLMPVIGRETGDSNANASSYDNDFVSVSPCEYKVLLEDYDINCSFTVDMHSAVFKIEMPDDGYAMMYMPTDSRAFADRIYVDKKANKFMSMGIVKFEGEMQFDEIPTDLEDTRCYRYRLNKGTHHIKAGMSYIDTIQAEDNLNREIPNFDYDTVYKKCFETWNYKLSRLDVTGGSEADKRCFYTGMFRALLRMSLMSEYGRYYSPYDDNVHDDDGHQFYLNDTLWDTFRTSHPLQQIIEPEVHRDIVESYLRMYRQCGYLPNSPQPWKNRQIMLGYHAAALFADSLANGMEFDVETAFEACKKQALEFTMLPWTLGQRTDADDCYDKNGFFPALEEGREEYLEDIDPIEHRQSVSVSLEYAYDDWCTAQLAKHIGNKEEEERFLKRSRYYINSFNKESGFMHPRTADGKWVESFDPRVCGGQGGRAFFAEVNAWIYTFNVMHDVNGLIELMGGNDKFSEKLDRLFIEQPPENKYKFLSQFPDATGLVGQFCMGNEPSFHIPYLYNYCGKPWKAQRRLRQLMKLWFTDTPLGICGDEDGGAMSAWYVLSAMGFYPVCPGSGNFDIGSPLFDKVAIHSGDNVFEIISEGASGKAKYIESITLDGVEIGSKIPSKAMLSGGRLVMNMAERPNKNRKI